jgi:hypothetical protein
MTGRHRHRSHARPDVKPIDDELHVVTMLSNPLRWRSRYWNYWAFEHEVEKAGAILYTAEIAYGDRDFEVTSEKNPRHLQLRSQSEIWLKENALNLMMQRLPRDARYVAWVDADVSFARPDWAQETMQELQHYSIVQMFSQAQDMGPDYKAMGSMSYSYGYCYREGLPRLDNPGPFPAAPAVYGATLVQPPAGVYWHPGFAWAARREALDHVGGLIDFAILGSADWHMATALVGDVERSLSPQYHDVYKRWVRQWAARADRHLRRDLGYVPGLLLHSWHGAKRDRQYDVRHREITRGRFNPEEDLKRDWQGLWQLNPDNPALRDAVRRLGRARREDG